MRKTVSIPSCVLSLVLAASPCVADPFCDGLRKVAQAAPTQFHGMWSESNPPAPTWSVEGTYNIPGAAPLHLQGGSLTPACSAEMTAERSDPNDNRIGAGSENVKMLPGHYFYFCEFPAPAGAVAASDALVARVAGCLATQVPQPTEDGADFRTYEIVQSGIKYTVHAADDPDQHDLNVTVMQDFAPGQ